MTLEIWNSIATFGTFVVISATAIAAIVQLRHARGGNQIAALNELRDRIGSSEFREAERFILTELADAMKDPVFRRQLVHMPERTPQAQAMVEKINMVGYFYEGLGVLIKMGLVDRDLAFHVFAGTIVRSWSGLEPVTALSRRTWSPTTWENFEYLAVLTQDWLAAHPHGTYPAGVRRLEVRDDWSDADA